MPIIGVAKIVDTLERSYLTSMPRLREHIEKLTKEYPRCKEMRASFITDNLLEDTLEAARERYDDNYEFMYDRKSGLVISGINWHADFAREMYADLYPDIYEKVGFNDMADHMFEEVKAWGFKSSVSAVFLKEFSLNYVEKNYFKRFLPQEY